MTDNELAMHIRRAANGNRESIQALAKKYAPLMVKFSKIDGVFNEDLFQELNLKFLTAITQFGK